MSSPTEDNLNNQLQNSVDALENLDSANTAVADIDTYEQSFRSDWVLEQATSIRSFRTNLAAALALAADILTPIFLAFSKHIVNKPAATADEAITNYVEYQDKNNRSVLSRSVTYGTPTAGGSNVGQGPLRRLVVDKYGQNIESGFFNETKTVTIVNDAVVGTARLYEEGWQLKGQAAGRDSLDVSGSNADVSGNAKTSNQSLLANSTFSRYSIAGTVSPGSPYTLVAGDTISNWNASDVTKLQLTVDSADIYREVEGDSTPTALRLLDDVSIEQTFKEAGISLEEAIPVDILVPTKRENLADGALTITYGNQSFSVADLTTLANDDYNNVQPDLDENLWPENISVNDAKFKIEWSGRSVGELVIDEIGFVLFDQVNQQFILLHGATRNLTTGATISFIVKDTWSITDSIASDSKIQKWVWRAFERYLRHEANATQVTASGGRTLQFTAPDTITASSGSFITDGYKVGMRLVIAGTTSNNGTKVIEAVTALTITTVETDLVNEGPLSATATLNAGPTIPDP